MNSFQKFIKKSLRIRSSTSSAHDHKHKNHQHRRLNESSIKLDKDNFTTIDKVISGELIIKSNDEKIKEITKICIKFYDELSIEWEEYQACKFGMDTKTLHYKTYKQPFKIDQEYNPDPNCGVLQCSDHSNTIFEANSDHHHHKFYEFHYKFEFDIPQIIHSTVNLPNASYNYYIEAVININDPNPHKHSLLDHFNRTANHPNTCKVQVNIYNKIITPYQLTLHPGMIKKQFYELQAQSLHIRVTIPKRAYFSAETIPISIDIDELDNHGHETSIDNSETGHHHHKLKIHKIEFKLYQLCKVYVDEPEKKSKKFDKEIKHLTRKISGKMLTETNQLHFVENFEIPDELFSTTDRVKLKQFNNPHVIPVAAVPSLMSNFFDPNHLCLTHAVSATSSIMTKMSIDDHVEGSNRFFHGIRVDYKLVVEFWKSFLNHDAIVNIPIMIDHEA
jgi:hypothetical protein